MELGEWISEQDLEIECDFSHHETEGEIIVNDEELEMDDEEIKEFYYKGAEESYEPKEDWYISREYSTDLRLEYENADEDFDKSKLKWVKDGEGGLEYEDGIEDEGFDDFSGGESNGDETRLWKVKVQGIDYFGHW